LYVHPLAKITTPYDVIFNRMTERQNQHGSCGLGIASTMKRHNETGYKLYALDTLNPKVLIQKLNNISVYYTKLVAQSNLDITEYLEECSSRMKDFIWMTEEDKFFEIRSYNFLNRFANLIFEGSQGVMLDMDHGIFPNVTYSNTTSKNAIEICNKLRY
jgi:adenylosuccinate synthase